MIGSKKVFVGEGLDANQKKELNKKQKEEKEKYDEKVNKLRKKCENFEKYLSRTSMDTSVDSISICFENNFGDFMKGKIFSRTSRVLNKMDSKLKKIKKLKLGEVNVEKIKEVFQFEREKIDKGYIKNSAIDDLKVFNFFNTQVPGILEERRKHEYKLFSLEGYGKEYRDIVEGSENFQAEIDDAIEDTDSAVEQIKENMSKLLGINTTEAKRNSQILTQKKNQVEDRRKKLQIGKKKLAKITENLEDLLGQGKGNAQQLKQKAQEVKNLRNTVSGELSNLEKGNKELEKLNVQTTKIIKGSNSNRR